MQWSRRIFISASNINIILWSIVLRPSGCINLALEFYPIFILHSSS